MLIARVACLLIVAAIAACDGEPRGQGIDVDRAMTVVQALAGEQGGPRFYNQGDGKTPLWIEHELAVLGVPFERAEVGRVRLPAIEVLGTRYRPAHEVSCVDWNVLARFGPPDGKALLIMAHYDTVAGSPGAVDNAASVGLLLALAKELRWEPPAQPVILAFTAAEEVGLVGAEALAAQLGDEVAFAIALDMVGGDGPLVVNGASTLIGRAELAWLQTAADATGVELSVPIPHRVVSRFWPQAERADHGAFTRRGVRAIHFYNRGNDGEWIDRAYHSDRDVPSRVHRESVADVGRLLRALIAMPVPAHDGDGFDIPLAHVVVPRWALVAFDLALALAALAALFRKVQRDRRRGLGLVAGLVCFALAALAAYVAELATLPFDGAWTLSPLAKTIASTLVLAGAFGLVTRAAARLSPWIGAHRYRVVAAAVPLAIGVALLALGAAELAWVWLVPAAAIAVLPAPIGVLASLLPALLVLSPLQLREGVWNGFIPPSLPLSLLVAVIEVPFIASVAWMLRRRAYTGPLGTFVLGVGCGLAVIAGLSFAALAEPACRPREFSTFGLACERV
ncbi:MAG: Zn-dependent exopeptidase M28 [Kofleriaceae bacterium]|nr:Zn-dependent exopeptidase M28 [Kofleriaceae bacterium]